MTLSRKVVRLFKKRVGTEDVETLFQNSADAAQHVGSNHAVVKELLVHLPELCADIDEAYAQYDERIRVALHSLQLSSEELGQANFVLEKLNASIKAMLESLGQGFLFFDKTGVCAPIFSKACLELLEKDPANRPVTEVLGFDEKQTSSFLSLMELVFDPEQTALSFEELMNLAPQEYKHSQNRVVSLAYKPMHNAAGAVNNALLIATDITEEVAAKTRSKHQEAQVMRLLRVAQNKDSFTRYLRNCSAIVAQLTDVQSLENMKRDLHTLKGMGRMFFLDAIAEIFHQLEDELDSDVYRNKEFDKLLPMIKQHQAKLMTKIDEARGYGREIWGDSFENESDIITLDTRSLLKFSEMLKKATPQDLASGSLLRAYFEQIASVPLRDLFGVFEAQVLYSAELSGRHIAVNKMSDPSIRVFPDFYKSLFDSLVHIARNIIDHAADERAEREALKKPARLQIGLNAEYIDAAKTRVRLVISDDGKGIDPEIIRDILKKKMPKTDWQSMKDTDVIQQIFESGFTTKDVVDINAGRGVGLNAVKEEAEKIGGAVRVTSELGKGTSFIIELPVLTGI